MRVGIYLNNINPDSGGSYTVEQSMLQAILSQLKNTGMVPVVFSDRENINLDVEYRSLKPGLGTKIKFRIKSKLQHYKKVLTGVQSSAVPHYKNRIIEKSGLDVFIYLTPMADFNLDIPYLTILWDLQHRLQPFFPEVSRHQVFEDREKLYGHKLKKAAYIICGTQRGKDEVVHFYNVWPDRVKVIPFFSQVFPAINTQGKKNIFEKYGISKKFIFYPAQFWAHKNHINLLKAFQQIISDPAVDLDLVLVGSDKGNLDFVKEFVQQHNLQQRVKFLGFIPNDDLADLYRNCVALTYVSYFGPDNLPPLEAFGLGSPVIAANVPGSEEQLGDAALLIDAGQPAQIAEAVIKIMNDPALVSSLVDKGHQIAAERTAEMYGKKIVEVLDEFKSFRLNWK